MMHPILILNAFTCRTLISVNATVSTRYSTNRFHSVILATKMRCLLSYITFIRGEHLNCRIYSDYCPWTRQILNDD